jgi:hypothetical protein
MRAVIADGFELGARVYFTISIARRAGHACGSSCDSGFMVRTDRSGTSAAEFASGVHSRRRSPGRGRPPVARRGTVGILGMAVRDPGDGRQGKAVSKPEPEMPVLKRARALRVECWPL